MQQPYKVCTRCVMDTTAEDIVFDDRGICNYCTEFISRINNVTSKHSKQSDHSLEALIEKIKKEGKNKRYDCIVGVSGGVDSSWALVKAVEMGLRPLAVHMDNGWNSELAQHNISQLVNQLGVDLYTHVIHWDEYRLLMQAFFDADVIDIELLYDNAMLAVNYQLAQKYNTRYILSGSNQLTEGMRMPHNWNWLKFDKKNIKAIGHLFQHIKINTFPAIGTLHYIYYTFIRQIQWVPFLDYVSYNKREAQIALQQKVDYKPYPYKHYESIFTRFYQGFLLPKKFGVDKRKIHFSTLIVSGQMTRHDALLDLEKIPYTSEHVLEEDKAYFLKKMKWTPEDLENYLGRASKRHDEYPCEKPFYNFCFKIYQNYIKSWN